MRDKKYYIALNDFERRVVVNCLNEMRNNLIANGKYTDAVDEVLLKIIDAKQILFPVIRSCIEQQSLPSFHQELPIEPARFQGRNVMGGVALIKQALLEGNLLLRIMEM